MAKVGCKWDMGIVKLTQGLDMTGYARDCDRALSHLYILTAYLTPEHCADLLRTYNIAVKEMVSGVDNDRQDMINDAADMMRHVTHVAGHYLHTDQAGWRNSQEALVTAEAVIGLMDVVTVIDILTFRSRPAARTVVEVA